MERFAAIVKQNVFFQWNVQNIIQVKHKLYICGTLTVKQVNVLYIMIYLRSSESGDVHPPNQYCWGVN